MLRELVELAGRFAEEGKLPPSGYRAKAPKWIVHITRSGVHLEGPYTRKEVQSFYSPDRQRSGVPSPGNVKPYLLTDEARYVFGVAERGKEKEARLLHQEYLRLLEEAHRRTGVESIRKIIELLSDLEKIREIQKKLEPRDLVTFSVEGEEPTLDPAVLRFWADYLAEKELLAEETYCTVCGHKTRPLRYLPREVYVLGQKCQVSSFNKPAFCSYGKNQGANAPLCPSCANRAIDVLAYLLQDKQATRHRKILVRDPEERGLKSQVAVFWLKKKCELTGSDGVSLDFESILGVPLEPEKVGDPPPALSQLQALLSAPWTGAEQLLSLAENQFYLAVVSANKCRFVLRAWFNVSLRQLRTNLVRFLAAVRVGGPWGEEPRSFSIPAIVEILDIGDSSLVVSLLYTAYLGYLPPRELCVAVLQELRNPKVFRDERRMHRLAAALKLACFYGREEEELRRMERLDPKRDEKAYLCGRLLAILEEAQLRALGSGIKSSLVDRFYPAASVAPAASFAYLLNQTRSSHFPKLRKEQRGCAELEVLLEEVLSELDRTGGFPVTLSLTEQSEFALGFYYQRAEFRARRRAKNKAGVASPTTD